jgi:serine/threonine-protein kinase
MGIRAAKEALQGLGFQVKVEKTDFFVGLWYVVGSDPDPGSMAPYGSTVTLKIV